MPDIPLPTASRGRHARATIALGLALLGAFAALSCSSDAPGPSGPPGPREPEQPAPVSTLTTLEVTPTAADLCVSGNTVQLTIIARDQTGAVIPGASARYSSSAPAIATVSGRGVVSAGAPGSAVITATATGTALPRTASMNVTVHERSAEIPEIAGVYDLNALITGTDGALGAGAEGTRQTAVLSIQHSGDTPVFAGTFTDFLAIDPDGASSSGSPGFVTGALDCVGRLVIELTFEGSQTSYWGGQGTFAGGKINGTFSAAGGVLGGTFTAVRRQAP